MADRNVYRTQKDDDGDILALCNPGQTWSPRKKFDAISDIENDFHAYFSNGESKIQVVHGPNGKYLRTAPDGSTGNNLDELPDC